MTAETDQPSAPMTGQGETILLVDDEETILTAVQRVLEENGYRVVTARNGKEALVTFVAHQQEVKLVVTDLMMPEMDGLNLARALRRLDQDVPIIGSSGLDPAAQTAEVEAGNIAEFLHKPYEQATLLATIRRHLPAAAD